ncbi:hypothetical protein XAC3810_280016 [Xanthomonas citri pv. citri]|nr:hypothetical protein XAC3810_280016 [Xanthomonas citri pv. citri]CEE35130.1 hypothetical protein XAC902_330118 [Xanthomonas citri pv. citri]CEF24155.1 hypothetical protein XACJK2_470009 [Xanthomonas citri pv. citri]CEF44760.1 hypothetical protein XAC217_320016 [Xanthomonas citri pv. citri]CEH46349.1 hypothetical protein XACLG97_3690004 [Xanthomonas citri pv. citri]
MDSGCWASAIFNSRTSPRPRRTGGICTVCWKPDRRCRKRWQTRSRWPNRWPAHGNLRVGRAEQWQPRVMRSDWRWLQCSAIAQRVQTAKQPVHAIDAALGANNPRHRIMQSSATHRAVPCRAMQLQGTHVIALPRLAPA